ncbi:hypothetical protein D3C86_2161850 [compost metagenome]
MLVRWRGKIKPGSVSNGIQAAAAGVPDVAARLRESNNVHIDGVNNLEHWQGKGV